MRTYLPKLLFLVALVCRYSGRWDNQIRRNLNPSFIPAYEAMRAACEFFEAIYYGDAILSQDEPSSSAMNQLVLPNFEVGDHE